MEHPTFNDAYTVEHNTVPEDLSFKTADELPNVEDFINDIIVELQQDDNEVNKRNIIRCSWSKVTNKEITEDYHHEVVSWCKANCPQDPNEVIE